MSLEEVRNSILSSFVEDSVREEGFLISYEEYKSFLGI